MIALGTVQHAAINTQIMVVSLIAIMITFVVYGLVAFIVKIDDAGLYLLKKQGESTGVKFQKAIGSGLLSFAPKLMKSLTYIGTVAMFLVGGGIMVHGVPWIASVSHDLENTVAAGAQLNSVLNWLAPTLFAGLVGIACGAILVAFHSVYEKFRSA